MNIQHFTQSIIRKYRKVRNSRERERERETVPITNLNLRAAIQHPEQIDRTGHVAVLAIVDVLGLGSLKDKTVIHILPSEWVSAQEEERIWINGILV